MSPRVIAAGCLALVLMTGSCARPAYQAQPTQAATQTAQAAETAPEPTPPLPVAAPESPAPPAGNDLFVSSVRPILESHCTPCHFPGGKMYERLPFDKAETLASHREGALRRLKGDDRAAFEAWLKTLP